MITPNPLNLSLLKHAQERNLGLHGKIANLIEEQCPTISSFKLPHASLHSTVKAPFSWAPPIMMTAFFNVFFPGLSSC